VRWIPTSYIIDPEGRIVDTALDGDDLLNKLAAIFEK
jgi:hypothetical protein